MALPRTLPAPPTRARSPAATPGVSPGTRSASSSPPRPRKRPCAFNSRARACTPCMIPRLTAMIVPVTDRAVRRHDHLGLQGLERVEGGQPRLHARHRGGRQERVVHDDVAGEEHVVPFDEEPGIATGVRGTDHQEAHAHAAEIEHVLTIEGDGRRPPGRILQELGREPASGPRTSAPSASRSRRTPPPAPSS